MCVYTIPKLIDINAKSRLIRGKRKLLIISRCIEVEHPEVLNSFKDDYAIVSVCLEEEHINQVGFKLAGVLVRGNYDEIAVLSVDGSPHCVQLHFMVEEVFKVTKYGAKRNHMVLSDGKVIKVSEEVVKTARYLSKVSRLLTKRSDG
ncbi:MAG: 4Fe-4S ferredoxin [Thermoprotei archaeon]|nr:MAG: 4Fe-4S ferredoxin [Thermoprotei archaeon]